MSQSVIQAFTDNPISLDSLSREPGPVLVDTCALFHDSTNGSERNIEEKILGIEFRKKSMDFFLAHIKAGANIFFTPRVIREVTKPPAYDCFPEEDLENLKPYLDDEYKSAVDFGLEIEDLGRILRFSSKREEIYEYLKARYKGVSNYFNLSPADSEFFFSGLALARSGENPVGITNDIDIHRVWEKIIIIREGIDKQKFQFYVRTGFDHFQPFDFSRISSHRLVA